MKSSELNSFFLTDYSGKDLKAFLDDEVLSYTNLMKKKGSTVPLIFYENEDVFINVAAINKLLKETLVGNLSNIHLAYICDCLTLSEKVEFENEDVKDAVFEIADPEINGGYKSEKELERMIDFFNPE